MRLRGHVSPSSGRQYAMGCLPTVSLCLRSPPPSVLLWSSSSVASPSHPGHRRFGGLQQRPYWSTRLLYLPQPIATMAHGSQRVQSDHTPSRVNSFLFREGNRRAKSSAERHTPERCRSSTISRPCRIGSANSSFKRCFHLQSPSTVAHRSFHSVHSSTSSGRASLQLCRCVWG